MRMVFSSPRLENVEAVAKMLTDAGIQVKLVNDRSYKGGMRKNFSYRDPPDAEGNAQVWVIKAEDQHTARAMLREQGLFESTRHGFGFSPDTAKPSYLPASAHAPGPRQRDRRAALLMRLRLALLVAIVLITILGVRGAFHL